MLDDLTRPSPPTDVHDVAGVAAVPPLPGAAAQGVAPLEPLEEEAQPTARANTPPPPESLTGGLGPRPVAGPGDDARQLGPSPPARGGAAQARQRYVALFGSSGRRGGPTVARRVSVTAVFCTLSLDLRHATFQPGVTEIHCVAAFGSVGVELPAHIRVDARGAGVFGAFPDRAFAPASGAAEAPVVRITGRALFGAVETEVDIAETPPRDHGLTPRGRPHGCRGEGP